MAGGTGSGWEVPGSVSPATGRGGGAGTGSGWEVPGGSAPSKVPHKTGGGFFHWVGDKIGLAAHDIKTIPGGTIHMLDTGVYQPWKDFVTTGHVSPKHNAQIDKLTSQTVDSVAQSINHPLRDPFQTALTVLPVTHGVGNVAAKASAASEAVRAGEGASGAIRAASKRFTPKPLLLKVGDKQVPLPTSRNPTAQGVKRIYLKTLQKAVDTNPEGRVAAHAMKRAAGSLSETARYQQRMQEAPANVLEAQGAKLGRRKGPLAGGVVPQSALRMVSENRDPAAAAAFHRAQAAKGIGVKDNLAQAEIADKIVKLGLLTKDEHGNVVVDAVKHPGLAALDEKLAAGQAETDKIIASHGEMTREGLQARINAPGRIQAGAQYEKPTPGKAGVSPALDAAKAQRDRIAAQHEKVLAKEEKYLADYAAYREAERTKPENKLDYLKSPRSRPAPSNPFRNDIVKLGVRLEAAQQKVDQLTAQAEARTKPTGIVGGEQALPGRGYVPAALTEARAPRSSVAGSTGPVIGKVQSFVNKKQYTGAAMQHGKIPPNTTGLVARNMRRAYRYVNTDRFRRTLLATGSELRRTSRDVLVRNPDETAAKITPEIDAILGRKNLTADEALSHEAAFTAYLHDTIPGLRDKFATDRANGIGVQAPDGYKWVDKNILGDLAKAAPGPRGRVARTADSINSAVTAATVYFKVGHIGTRALTNASTNILQGAANPLQLKYGVSLWHELTPEERVQSLAASGQHGYAAMPHEGTSKAAKIATTGANWWAKHIDAPFRFNSLAYEARKAGFDTPEKFRFMLQRLQNHEGLDPQLAATIDGVAKRANRAGIAYDRLNAAEQNYINRGIWFYPWIKGATMFGGHTLIEHPYKSFALGTAGVQGRELQQQELGDLPSFEQGLFRVAGGARPLVADFSTFSPFATPANVLDAVERPRNLAGFLNPVTGASAHLAFGLDQFGNRTNHPYTSALSEVFSPAPESQIANALANRGKDQSKRMFQTTWQSALARSLAGPGLPRRINLTAAHSTAGRERSGR